MTFDIKKVKTCATAHEVEDGAKGWGANSIFELKIYVEGNKDSLLFVIDEKRGAGNIAFPFNSSYRYFYPYEKATYEELQAEHIKREGWKVGDKVRIINSSFNDRALSVSRIAGIIDVICDSYIKVYIPIIAQRWICHFPDLELIKNPTYRPFANAEEFKPYRSRWVKINKGDITRFNYYNNNAVYNDLLGKFNYQKLFDICTFEDGSPCGVAL